MKLSDFCRELQISSCDQYKLEPVWEELIRGWDGSLPFFLNQEYFDRLYPCCKAPFTLEQVRPCTAAVIRIAQENPAAALLAHLTWRGEFELAPAVSFDFLPDPLPFFGEKYSGMFSFMISLGAYPLIVKAYAEAGVPESYAQDALQWFGGTMSAYGAAHDGLPGRPYRFGWIRHYIDKRLFRIGRLEYLMHNCIDWLPAVYLHENGELAVLCRDGWTFRADGRRAEAGEPAVFTTRLTETDHSVTGTPCSPDGVPDFEHPLTLNVFEWKPAVSPWDLCPSIHIPSGSRMPFEEVKESLLAAREFFARYFQRRVPLFCCCSWILNPAWEFLLNGSNMARFRQEGFAFPSPSWGSKAGMGFIFGRDDVSPLELPAVNSVQRAFQEAYCRNLIGTGGIFLLSRDLEKLGTQYYRKNCRGISVREN